MKRVTLPRLLLALFAVVAAACSVSIAFDLDRTFDVTTTNNSFDGVRTVDLARVAAIQDHKGKLESLSIDWAEVSVVSVNAGNAATVMGGTVWLRPEGGAADGSNDVIVGSFSGVPIAVGTTRRLTGQDPGLSQAITAIVHGNGVATFRVSASTDGLAAVTLEVKAHGSLTYGSGLKL